MSTTDWEKVRLKDNPFSGTPPVGLEKVIWAGMSRQKELIEKRIKTSLATSPYALVLNWGPWGGGKTHSARYFGQVEVLEDLSAEVGTKKPLFVFVNLPRGSKDVVRDIYLDIVNSIGLKSIQNDLFSVRERLGDKEFLKLINAFIKDEGLASSIALLAYGNNRNGQQNLFPEHQESAFYELRRYFSLSASAGEVKSLKLVRPISSTSDILKILTTIFNLLLHSDSSVEPEYSELILWFDEMEEILSLSGKEQSVLTSLIRDLTDYIPKDLTIFINFTPRPGGDVEDVGIYLTPAVWSRVRDQILFTELNAEEIKEYICEMLNAPHFRPDGFKDQCPERSFPFSEDALQTICEKLEGDGTPRKINEVCSFIMEQALNLGIFEHRNRRIDVEFIQEVQEELDMIISKTIF